MKKYIKYIIIFLIIILIFVAIILGNKKRVEDEKNENLKIVTSFYPVYIMTANITEGANNIELMNMTDTNIGCIHDYVLSTLDMKKIENADLFIQNGLGLENFIEKITISNNKLQIIDSSENMINLIKEDDKVNSHIWTSIPNYILQVQNISKKLIEKNPENAELYERNTTEYIKKLTNLKLKYETELQELYGKNAVCLNEAFEYFGKNIGLNLTTIKTSHEESALSAETLKHIIDDMKQNNTKIIIIDINDDIKNAQTIANETGAKIYKLDSGLTGNLNKDSYINSMNGNLEKLKNK